MKEINLGQELQIFKIILIVDGWFKFGHSFVPSFLQQVYAEHLLYAGHCAFSGEGSRYRPALMELLEMK